MSEELIVDRERSDLEIVIVHVETKRRTSDEIYKLAE
jgi:hypothetical protein